ncbi:hypothetical protein HDU67_006244 [Dinochytrium kinnereticum]|nr:hypothetical protein HDU67_006244 [Dinochytrium kinnereticum]
MDATRTNLPTAADAALIHEEEVHDTVHANAQKHTAPAERVIAIAVDGSPSSKVAFDWAVKNVVRPELDQVIILSARPHAMLPQEIEIARKKGAHTIVRNFADTLPPYKYRVRAIALVGDPRESITKKCEELKADIVVVGSRNLGPVKRALLGSVSEYVVRHCSCSVVVARG